MMLTELIFMLINQQQIQKCVNRMDKINRKLTALNIQLNYRPIYRFVFLLIGINVSRVILSVYFSFEQSSVNANIFQMISLHLPVFVCNLSKSWFIVLVCDILIKFRAVNKFLENFADLQKYPVKISTTFSESVTDFTPDMPIKTIYLHKEIVPFQSKRRFFSRNATHSILLHHENELNGRETRESIARITTTIIALSKVHEEICELGKTINILFSFQILMTMAHVFLVITANLYFLYVGITGQQIPIYFQWNGNVPMSVVFFLMIFFYCTNIAFICWRTQNDANRMGIYLHRIANRIDDAAFYEKACAFDLKRNELLNISWPFFIQKVNHLSFKVLSHRLNFSACGFFSMDMTTIYSVKYVFLWFCENLREIISDYWCHHNIPDYFDSI